MISYCLLNLSDNSFIIINNKSCLSQIFSGYPQVHQTLLRTFCRSIYLNDLKIIDPSKPTNVLSSVMSAGVQGRLRSRLSSGPLARGRPQTHLCICSVPALIDKLVKTSSTGTQEEAIPVSMPRDVSNPSCVFGTVHA